mmetsp:Transcript_99955/g.158202  ORF Transcript_99955/g.158202 Transcript_99955/m.158202 type:complete len:150 (+) Transcript_99955:60-509(+)
MASLARLTVYLLALAAFMTAIMMISVQRKLSSAVDVGFDPSDLEGPNEVVLLQHGLDLQRGNMKAGEEDARKAQQQGFSEQARDAEEASSVKTPERRQVIGGAAPQWMKESNFLTQVYDLVQKQAKGSQKFDRETLRRLARETVSGSSP